MSNVCLRPEKRYHCRATALFQLLVVVSVIAWTDAESSGTCGPISPETEAVASATEHSKLGSCLLQARSLFAALRGVALEDSDAALEDSGGALEDSATLNDAATLQDPHYITPEYWFAAEETLRNAALSTPKPEPTKEPNERPAGSNEQSKSPWVQSWKKMQNGDQPFHTRIGAALLYHFSVDELTMGTRRPPPTQGFVTSQLHANCPLVLFQNTIDIFAPLCGQSQGTWIEPASKRVLMRWEKEGHDMHFGVDSSMSGNGSANFARIQPQVLLSGYKWSLLNCMGTSRYSIDEAIIKVNKMGDHERTLPHHLNDASDHEQYFFRYALQADDGTVVMETNLFQMFSDSVQFSMVTGDGIRTPMNTTVVAKATRKGRWTQNGWRSCGRTDRGWHLEFPEKDYHNLENFATVMDIRVAATAIITLMASRDEDRDLKTGLASSGEGEIFLSFARTFVVMIQACLILCCCCALCTLCGIKDKSKKLLFDVEGAMMPKRAMATRAAPLHPVY